MTSVPLTYPTSLIPRCAPKCSFQRCHWCIFVLAFRSFLYRDETSGWSSNQMTVDYFVTLHWRRSPTVTQTQRKLLERITTSWRITFSLLCGNLSYRQVSTRPAQKEKRYPIYPTITATRLNSSCTTNKAWMVEQPLFPLFTSKNVSTHAEAHRKRSRVFVWLTI